MAGSLNESFEQFIHWQKSYDTCILLINEQHKGVLNFINQWYDQLKEGRDVGNLADFVRDKFNFLMNFSKGHLRFESELLRLLKDKYEFPIREYTHHLEKHRWFLESFLIPLTKQLNAGDLLRDHNLLEDMAKGGLMDTARWWYNHIRTPKPGEEPGPDHIYRTHLETLPVEAMLEIVNQMAVFIALHDNTFWLRDVNVEQA